MKKIILPIAIILFTLQALAQQKVKFDFHGFIKTDYWWDTRKTADAREGIFCLFPIDEKIGADNNDLNGEGSFNFSAITSRANVKISGQKAFGADVVGFMEADFAGMSNTNTGGFRIRHAFINLNWEKSSLLLGQFWHPLFVTEVFPRVISLNTGAPFQPFNRSPQIRYTYRMKKLNLIAAALNQQDYVSRGPAGKSRIYLSNSLVPNGHLQLRYKGKHHTFGAAYDIKMLRPTQVSDSNWISNEMLTSMTVMAFYNYKNKRFQIRSKAILGQNLTEQLMLGGYAVSFVDSLSGTRHYTPTNHVFTFVNALYDFPLKKENNKIRVGGFAGYAKNLGTSEQNNGTYYAMGSNIDELLRGSASLSFISGKVQLSLEWEHTVAHYGTADADGIVQNTHPIANNRFLFTGFYFF